MRNINLRYVNEAYDEGGVLVSFDVNCPADFNFGYDVVDDIAANDPDRRAMVWCNPEGENHVFTFADMKRWSDKTANFLAEQGIGRGDTTSSGSWPPRWRSWAPSWCPPPSCSRSTTWNTV